MTEYLFVDGGYLRACYAEVMTDFFGTGNERNIDFKKVREGCGAQKAFYYDCLDDLRKPGETDEVVQKRVADQEAFLNAIRSEPGYHVILGSLSGTKPKNARQKQVDVHLAVDMLNHAVRRNMAQASLLTGDLDFKPVIESLIDLGIYTRLHYVRKHTAQELVWSADEGREIDFRLMHDWSKRAFRNAHPIPGASIGESAGAGFVQLKTGTFNEQPVWLYGMPGSPARVMIIQCVNDDIKMLKLEFNDLTVMEKYFKRMYGGEIVWS